MIIPVNLNEQGYDIVLQRGALQNVSSYLNLNRKALIVTDSGVPTKYLETLKNQIQDCVVYTFPQGEQSKNIDTYTSILKVMVEAKFTRSDCVIALGGGVVGDLSGFVASTYMRGIDFYNIPTTLLSQLDSSIGGKVAIDFAGVKNIVGAFYQPKKVIIDSDTLKTLDKRQLHAGLCEAIKMAATSNSELFELIENSTDLENDLDKIIEMSLLIKKDVVEKDPKEKGLRRVLNFGHTVGHAIESKYGFLHGECVGIGMLPMCAQGVRSRIEALINKYSLPILSEVDKEALVDFIKVDKKAKGSKIGIVYVDKIGDFEIKEIDVLDIMNYLNEVFNI